LILLFCYFYICFTFISLLFDSVYIYIYIYIYILCVLIPFGLCTIQKPRCLGQITLVSICYLDGIDPNIDLGTQEVSYLYQ
jgi:hypothetical protein